MPKKQESTSFVNWFRQSSPYIHAHRGRTFVLAFGGQAVLDADFPHLVHDIALLQALGIRLVLVHGARPQIEERLKVRNITLEVVKGVRATDTEALTCVKEAVGAVRVEIEALFSMGLTNSPTTRRHLRVSSGNFVTARPLGVIDGIDYQHTGEVRNVDVEGIRMQLDNENMVLISPIGYSPTGEAFNLEASDVARSIATHLNADKLIMLTDQIRGKRSSRLQGAVTPKSVDQLLARRSTLSEQQIRVLKNAALACRSGVNRTHIIERSEDGVLLKELFTRDGAGMLVTAEDYEITRTARIEDVGGIIELIQPMETAGILVPRPRERLENEISHFTVMERDGMIIACAALYPFAKEKTGELACVAVHPDYRNQNRGDILLGKMEDLALAQDLDSIFVLTTQTAHWFRERGFRPSDVVKLPRRRRDLYNWQRNAKIFTKVI